LDCEGSAVAAADKVRTRLAIPYLIHQHRIEITTSIGLAIVATGESYRDVIRRADVEMYRDKARSAGWVTAVDTADVARR
jgi:predicted signal transduction protein with EAL and GGDEF domain